MRLQSLFIILATAVISITATVAFSVAALAQDYGGGSVQGYAADSPIDNGTIVQLTGDKSNRVKIAIQEEQQNMFGVAVDRSQLPIAISNSAIENETFVAVSGTYNVLVSTQAGLIEAGDYLALSSISGVAMKAGYDKTTVFGRANESFDGKSSVLSRATLKDVNGTETEVVNIGSIPVTIDIRNNPNERTTQANLPEFLEKIGQEIAQKEVNPIRIYLSLGITIVTVIAALAFIYSGVRNAIVAIGRNPMSKKSIFKALAQIILTSLIILIIGLFAVYLLLRL